MLDLLREVVNQYMKDGDVLWRLGVCLRQIAVVGGMYVYVMQSCVGDSPSICDPKRMNCFSNCNAYKDNIAFDLMKTGTVDCLASTFRTFTDYRYVSNHHIYL
jgi:hypothetical protein